MPALASINPIDSPCRVTQDQVSAAIREAQIALMDDRDALAQLDPRVYETLHQFLRVARQIQVEQMSLAEVQAKMAKALDDRWAHQRAPGLRSGALPERFKIIEALLKSPILVEIGKALIAHGI